MGMDNANVAEPEITYATICERCGRKRGSHYTRSTGPGTWKTYCSIDSDQSEFKSKTETKQPNGILRRDLIADEPHIPNWRFTTIDDHGPLCIDPEPTPPINNGCVEFPLLKKVVREGWGDEFFNADATPRMAPTCQGCGAVEVSLSRYVEANGQHLDLCEKCQKARTAAKEIPTAELMTADELNKRIKPQAIDFLIPPSSLINDDEPTPTPSTDKDFECLHKDLVAARRLADRWQYKVAEKDKLLAIVEGDLKESRELCEKQKGMIAELTTNVRLTNEAHLKTLDTNKIQADRINSQQAQLNECHRRIAECGREIETLKIANRSAEKRINQLNSALETANYDNGKLLQAAAADALTRDEIIRLHTDELNRAKCLVRQEGITQGVHAERKKSHRVQLLCFIVGMIIAAGLAAFTASITGP